MKHGRDVITGSLTLPVIIFILQYEYLKIPPSEVSANDEEHF
jgi:hypothetical protein